MGIILLDIGNVVVSVDFMPFCKAVSRNGEVGAMAVKGRYCEGELKDRFDSGKIAPQEFLGMVASDPLTLDIPLHELRSAWQEIFTLQKGCIEAIRQLQEHHTLWIMSDTDPLHFAFLLNMFPVLRSMERYFLSYVHGYLKRSPDAFRHVLDSSGIEACEFILIDDREVNCASGRSVGINTILFRNWPETLASPELFGDSGSGHVSHAPEGKL
jgi:FMN phosphatase YigB (HAD superfamily)